MHGKLDYAVDEEDEYEEHDDYYYEDEYEDADSYTAEECKEYKQRARHEQAAAMYTDEMPANVILQEWETVDVEDFGGSDANYARMVDEEPKAGPFTCFVDALNFLK